MNLNNWKIYDKEGNYLNWTPDPFLPLSFSSINPYVIAEGYLTTDVSGYVDGAVIINKGAGYSHPTSVYYNDVISEEESINITNDVSVVYQDVSIFNPNPLNTQGIGGLYDIDISTKLYYPSVQYTSAIYLKPVSQGLVETEHLYIFENNNNNYIRPYDPSTTIVFEFVGDEDQIKFFVVEEDSEEIVWVDTLQYDLDTYASETPLTLNIGFRSEEEGVYERILRIYNLVNGSYYLLAEIVVNAESIGEDERFRTLLGNFGLPDPKDLPRIFKETDINEALPDFEVINPKSKYMILEHDNIMPYVGTYKGLINSMKWLGYDDVYFKEWFKNVKEDKKISYVVPYEAKDRTQTILRFSPDERRALKKLNQLSLVYCINKETGDVDEWGTPETENCFEYNLEEVFVKLLGLKKWIERNILGVHARIIDLTGEGIYFERYVNLIYGIDNIEYDYRVTQSLTPYTSPTDSELIMGEASIWMSIKEVLEEMSLADSNLLNETSYSSIDYIWDPANPTVTLSADDPSFLANPDNYLAVSSSLTGTSELKELQWKASVSKPYSGVVPSSLVTNPLWIHNNQIKFYNYFDSSSVFFDSSINLDIVLEKAYIIDASGNDWLNDNVYFIYEDPSLNGGFIMEDASGAIYRFNDYVSLNTDTSALLQYAYSDTYRVPLLSFKNFRTQDASNNYIPFEEGKTYYLDILDGKISMNFLDSSSSVGDTIYYINFEYDYSTYTQKVNLNVEYYSDRMPLYVFDPSTYYWASPEDLESGVVNPIVIDNSSYTMKVNHTGDYTIEVFAWDAYNTPFTNRVPYKHKVWTKYPTIYSLTDSSKGIYGIDLSTYKTGGEIQNILEENKYPIFNQDYPYLGINLEYDSKGTPFINVPAITYYNDDPQTGSINKFYNVTEKVTDVDSSNNIITVDKRYQDFLDGDSITIFKTFKGMYLSILEASSYIVDASQNDLYLDNLPSDFILDDEHNIYILNDTNRTTSNLINNYSDPSVYDTSILISLDVSGYTFLNNQMVGIIVTDTCLGYTWGSSYRVLDVSGNTHILEGLLPNFISDNQSRYSIEAKHAFSTFVNYEIDTLNTIKDASNDFNVYLDDDYRQYFIDNNFAMMNIPFSHENVVDQWYKSSIGILAPKYYYRKNEITIDSSTLIVLVSEYADNNYMLNQKNVWTVTNAYTGELIFRVYNKEILYMFNEADVYDIKVESYDAYGNLVESNG